MRSEVFLSLVSNAALLLALGVLYDTIFLRPTPRGRLANIVTGVFIGAIGVALMLTPWQLVPGVVFDTRSILLSVSGLFFGLIPTVVGAVITFSLRLYQGGAGAFTGVLVICTSAALGLLWRHFRSDLDGHFSWFELYVFGIVVNVAMLLAMLSLPSAIVWDVLTRISLPVLAIYPIATVLLGMLLMHQRARVQAQEELRHLNADLEQRIEKRTEQLVAANQELEAFAYSVSHDLRAPLRAIDGFSRIVQEDYASSLDAEGNRLLDIVRTNTQQMDHLITDILTVSRVSRTEIRCSRIDMTAMANAMFHEVTTPEIQASFDFVLQSLPPAWADSVLMRRVWSNLLSNAIKYTLPKEKRCIEVGAYPQVGKNVYYVRDTGVGFNPEYTHKLFGPFQRLHPSDEFEGTGIGLAIVQRIVHRSGGQTWAEGEVGHGATFYFSLPDKEIKNESGGRA